MPTTVMATNGKRMAANDGHGNNRNNYGNKTTNHSGRDKSKVKCHGCGQMGTTTYIRDYKNSNQSSNVVSSLFIRDIVYNEELLETDFKWELQGLVKVVVNKEPNQKPWLAKLNGKVEN
jgi:hypothetical protein